VGVAEIRCQVGFKITKFFQKSRDLDNDSEDFFRFRMAVHFETFNRFIIFNNWVEPFGFKGAPEPAKVVFVIRIK